MRGGGIVSPFRKIIFKVKKTLFQNNFSFEPANVCDISLQNMSLKIGNYGLTWAKKSKFLFQKSNNFLHNSFLFKIPRAAPGTSASLVIMKLGIYYKEFLLKRLD